MDIRSGVFVELKSIDNQRSKIEKVFVDHNKLKMPALFKCKNISQLSSTLPATGWNDPQSGCILRM